MGWTGMRALGLVALGGMGAGWLAPAAVHAQDRAEWAPRVGISAGTALGQRDRGVGPGFEATLFRRAGRFGFGVEAVPDWSTDRLVVAAEWLASDGS